MGRKALPLDLAQMQTIMDRFAVEYNGTQTEFLQTCCDTYNEKNNPTKQIYPAILYNRIKKGELTTSVRSTKGTGQLSEEHKQKLLQGRKALPAGRRRKLNTDTRHAEYLRKDFPAHPKLVEKVLQGSMAGAIKAKCIECVCGGDPPPGHPYREYIRDCTSYGCPLYAMRPYRPTTEKIGDTTLTAASPQATVETDAA